MASEDDRYRTSTQYRYWSFTPSQLASLRRSTNSHAGDRVRAAIQRSQAPGNSPSESSELDKGNHAAAVPAGEVDCLTADEELRLVAHYCRQMSQVSDHIDVPLNVKATAIQYFKRFYTTNSFMTYPPSILLKTALYFSTKTENYYTRLTSFCSSIEGTKPADILASEFLLTQGLRFQFDVRHPIRALDGAIMELTALAQDPQMRITARAGEEDTVRGLMPANILKRINNVHAIARSHLKTSALITDAYFHYTPSQIMLASLLLGDREIASWYITAKTAGQPLQQKILSVIQDCASMLADYKEPSKEEMAELKTLVRKLKMCRNPEKVDLVALQRAKREGGEGLEEKEAKKRRVETAIDDPFGPAL